MNFLNGWDQGASYAMHTLHHPWLTGVMKVITSLGDLTTLEIVLAVAVFFFIVARRWRTACCLAAAMLCSYAVEHGVKEWVNRPRPALHPEWILVKPPASPSFPSGHAMLSMTLYPAIALGLASLIRKRALAALVVAVGFFLPLPIGFSRMYLGVHYMSDVAGGFVAGLGFVFFFFWLEQKWTEAARPMPALATTAEAHFRPQASTPEEVGHIQPSGGQVQR
jgi:membrane-associated phospholipid phosphatase